MTTITVEAMKAIHEEAKIAAYNAANNDFQTHLNGVDRPMCGFAWVNVSEKASTKLGKTLVSLGFRKSYDKGLDLWNPSGLPVQNVDVKELGAIAYADVLRKYGIKANARNRLD